jgi:hypothetical protein
MVCRLERRVGHLSGWRCKLDNGWPWEHVVHIRDVYNGHLIPPEQWQLPHPRTQAHWAMLLTPILEFRPPNFHMFVDILL